MFQKIIVGFDSTDTGHDGLALASGFAKAFASRVLVAYIYDEELAATSREAAAELVEQANAILAGARDEMSQVLDSEFRALPAGSPAHGLHDLAVSDHADLIVLGSRRLGPRTRAALGSVSENVMRAAPCAVAIAPRGYRNDGGSVPQTIGVGWIPTEEGEHALEVACGIAGATAGSVELMTTTSATADLENLAIRARRAADDVIAKLGAEVPVVINARVAKATEVLIERSDDLDLIVLGSRGYGPPRTMLLGSASSLVVPEAHCPTMILAARSENTTTT